MPLENPYLYAFTLASIIFLVTFISLFPLTSYFLAEKQNPLNHFQVALLISLITLISAFPAVSYVPFLTAILVVYLQVRITKIYETTLLGSIIILIFSNLILLFVFLLTGIVEFSQVISSWTGVPEEEFINQSN